MDLKELIDARAGYVRRLEQWRLAESMVGSELDGEVFAHARRLLRQQALEAAGEFVQEVMRSQSQRLENSLGLALIDENFAKLPLASVQIEAGKWREMVAALLEAEFGQVGEYAAECAACHGVVGYDHHVGCVVDAALTSAGFPNATSRDAGRARLKEERKP